MSKTTKKWIIIAFSLLLVGSIIFAGVMTMLKWDFTKLSTDKYVTNKHIISDNFQNISILTDTADIELIASENDQCLVVCYEEQNAKHSVIAEDGTLKISLKDNRKWYEHIGVSFCSPKITVYIPEREYGEVYVKASTGDIKAENVLAKGLEILVSTGRIEASNINCENDIKLSVSTGDTNLSDTKCKSLTSFGSTGDISLKNVIAKEKLSVKRSTGDIKLKGSDANELFITTDTGDIKGSLLSNKVFIANSDTGSVNVPKTTGGGKCEVITDTGDIKLEIK